MRSRAETDRRLRAGQVFDESDQFETNVRVGRAVVALKDPDEGASQRSTGTEAHIECIWIGANRSSKCRFISLDAVPTTPFNRDRPPGSQDNALYASLQTLSVCQANSSAAVSLKPTFRAASRVINSWCDGLRVDHYGVANAWATSCSPRPAHPAPAQPSCASSQ